MLALRILSDIPTRGTMLLSLNLRRIEYYTLIIGKVLPNVGIQWEWTTSLPLKMTCKGRWPSEFRYIQKCCTKSFNPKMELYEDQIRVWNESLRTSQLGLLIDPKSDSSVSKVIQQMSLKLFNGAKLYSKPPWRRMNAIVCEMAPSHWNEDRNWLWVQKMTQCQVKTKVCPVWTQDLDYLQKFLLRVVAHLVSQTHLYF
jgi:hypothetical protein